MNFAVKLIFKYYPGDSIIPVFYTYCVGFNEYNFQVELFKLLNFMISGGYELCEFQFRIFEKEFDDGKSY